MLPGRAPVKAVLRMLVPTRLRRGYRRPWPFTGPLGTITHVVTTSPVAALTFDDGPDPASTPRLLDILSAHGARATFFMLGTAAARYPEIVRDVARRGHAIGNHSWDHPSFALIRSAERREQLRRCAGALGASHAPLFRPPFGQQTIASRIDAARLKYDVVAWNVVGRDWLDLGVDGLTRDLLAQIRPGSIILLHDALAPGGLLEDIHTSRDDMLSAVANVLDALRTTMRFVTVPELLRSGRARREPWLVRPSAGFAERLAQRRAHVAPLTRTAG